MCGRCGERFELAVLEAIGDAMFCGACLDKMLRRVDKRSTGRNDRHGPGGHRGPLRVVDASPTRIGALSGGDRVSLARTPAADAPCIMCGESLDRSAFLKLRGVAICVRCWRSLLSEDAAAPIDDAAIGDPADERARGPRAGSMIDTPGGGTEWCSRCGCPIPGPRSYQLVDGRPYCTACVAARAPRRRLASPTPAPDADSCDACGRLLPQGPVPEISGFWLCAACRSSDPDLALALARARHQRRLARAYHRLIAGDDGGEDAGDGTGDGD